MPSPALHSVWHVMYSRFVAALTALTLSTNVVAAQTTPNMAAQLEVAVASPREALAYLGTVSGGLNNTASGVAATVGGGFGSTASGYFATVGGGFGNIAAGTGSFVAGSTIEEKALGNIQKIGRKCMVDGVIDKAEMPTGPGLWFMDSSSAAAEMTTLCAASGFVVHFFPTGQGNVIGNPILPVIKISANPRTVRTMSEHIDVDTSGLLQREITMDQAGDKLIDMMFRTVNGRLTAAEALGHREFVMTRLYESA